MTCIQNRFPCQSVRRYCVRTAAIVSLCSALIACGASTSRLDETNASIDALHESVNHSQAAYTQLTDTLAALETRQVLVESQLLDVAASVDTLQAQNAVLLEALKKSSKPKPERAPRPTVDEPPRKALGRVEWLWMPELQRYFSVPLDTALDLSVMYASDIQRFERDGEKWVRFTLVRNEWPTQVEAEFVRSDKIRYLGGTTELKGPVVRQRVLLNGFNDVIEFLLLPSKEEYPQIILGRNFLTDVASVDVALKYTVKRDAKNLSAEEAAEAAWREAKAAPVATPEPLPPASTPAPSASPNPADEGSAAE